MQSLHLQCWLAFPRMRQIPIGQNRHTLTSLAQEVGATTLTAMERKPMLTVHFAPNRSCKKFKAENFKSLFNRNPNYSSKGYPMKFRTYVMAILLTGTSTIAIAQCSYSAYVDFGPAMTGGYIDKKENVYRSSGLIKNLRTTDSAKNYRAVYTSYMQVKVGEFEIINIGPYDTEAIAYTELNTAISELIQRGYKLKTNSHSMPAVLIYNQNPC